MLRFHLKTRFMSWAKIWIHLVFSTKNRIPYLKTKEIRKQVCIHIKQNALKKDILIDCVNGHSDHIHCLISLRPSQSTSRVVKMIKGESSHWINKNEITQEEFKWQKDYWVSSVSGSQIRKVRRYIHNQEEHHKSISFEEEIKSIVKKNGLIWQKGVPKHNYQSKGG